jgi:hypothetical protein
MGARVGVPLQRSSSAGVNNVEGARGGVGVPPRRGASLNELNMGGLSVLESVGEGAEVEES